jgi:hypothetical protein
MIITKARATLVALAAIGALSAPGIASAATPKAGTPAPSAIPVTQSSARGIQGGSTDGNAVHEAVCTVLGARANSALENGDTAQSGGNTAQALSDYQLAQAIVDYGMDNGCFFTGPF